MDGAAGPLQARLYDATPGHPGEPIILYFHGGGWVTGDLNTYDASDRALATQAHAMVLSVAYRLAPENRFPAAHDDAFAAYRWLLANAARLGADPRRIAVAGESAGGNLAINVSIAARDAHIKPPVHELLIYPVAGTDTGTPSYIADENAQPLGRDDVLWYVNNTIRSPADLQDPRLDLIGQADLHNLPPTTIISAEIDPLESDGTFLTYKLQAQGVPVDRTLYGGTTHEFFGMGAAVARAKDAEAFAAEQLDATFDQDRPTARATCRGPRRRPGKAPCRAAPGARQLRDGPSPHRPNRRRYTGRPAAATGESDRRRHPARPRVHRGFAVRGARDGRAGGMDCSQRGEAAGFGRVADERTLLLPDRRGNNRCDSMRNIAVDGHCGLLFLVPESGTTLRVNGTAVLSTEAGLLPVRGGRGRTALRAGTNGGRSLLPVRAGHRPFRLWDPDRHRRPGGSALAGCHHGGADRRHGRWRALRPGMARTGPGHAVVTRTR